MSDREEINRVLDEIDARRWRKLVRLVGYPQDGSDRTITLFWDDTTNTSFIRLEPNRSFFSNSFEAVIDLIHEDDL